MLHLVRPALSLPTPVGAWVRLRGLAVAGPVAAGLDAERGLVRLPLPSGISGGSVGRYGKARCLALSPSGHRLAVGLADRVVRLAWPSGDLLDEHAVPLGVIAVAMDADGEVALAAGDGRVWMSGLDGPSGWGSHDAHKRRVLAVARRGDRVVTLDAGGQGIAVDVRTGDARVRGGLGEVAAIAFEPEADVVVLAQAAGAVFRWALDEADPPAPLFRVDGPVTALSVQEHSILLAHGPVTAWSRRTGGRRVFLAHRGRSVGMGVDDAGTVWSAARGEGLVALSDPHRAAPPWVGHRSGVRALVAHRGGVWTASRDGTLRRWRPDGHPLGTRDRGVHGQQALMALDEDALVVGTTAGVLQRLSAAGADDGPPRLAHEGPVTALARLAAGLVVSGGADGALRVWDGALSPITERRDHSDRLRCLTVLKGDLVLSGGYDGALHLSPALGGETLLSVQAHSRPVLGVAAVGERLASASLDGTLRFCSRSGAEEQALELDADGLVGLVGAPDGGLIAFGRSGRLVTVRASGEVAGSVDLPAPADGALWLDDRLLVGDQRGGIHELVWATPQG